MSRTHSQERPIDPAAPDTKLWDKSHTAESVGQMDRADLNKRYIKMLHGYQDKLESMDGVLSYVKSIESGQAVLFFFNVVEAAGIIALFLFVVLGK